MPHSFSETSIDPAVRGFLDPPASPSAHGLILTHGAGGNAQMALLSALAEAFSGAGFAVLRCDLPFRQKRRFGPPGRGDALRDRAGLKNAVSILRKMLAGKVFLGGQSYGGRQASMLLREEPVADGLLLLSYPLHPPGKPDQLRTEHLPGLEVPTLFVEGTRDPFASIEEIRAAGKLIPAKTDLLIVEGAGHDLGFHGKAKREELPRQVLLSFREFFQV